MQKWLTAAVISVMQALRIPISIFPFWYPNVRTDRAAYRPFYQPWRSDESFRRLWAGERLKGVTLTETAYLLYSLACMASSHPGEIWECGVYQGATARLLAAARDSHRSPVTLRLFDSFVGMPESNPDMDSYKAGSFRGTSLDEVKRKLRPFQNVHFHPGFIPETFAGLELMSISFAHIDVDQYETTKSCCAFIFPRLCSGGVLVIDDYGRPRTIGARIGADEFFNKIGISPVVLDTGQAIVIK
jgi:O-methyltransferase